MGRARLRTFIGAPSRFEFRNLRGQTDIPWPFSDNARLARDPVKGAVFLHPNGARRLTGLRVVAPDADGLPPAASYIVGHGLVKFDVGGRWLLDVTLDGGKQGVTRNLEPDLPMVVHY